MPLWRWVAVEECLRAWEALDLGLVEGAIELVALGDGGEVEEGAFGVVTGMSSLVVTSSAGRTAQ